MPTYDMKNLKTGEVKEMILKIAEEEAMVLGWNHIHAINCLLNQEVRAGCFVKQIKV